MGNFFEKMFKGASKEDASKESVKKMGSADEPEINRDKMPTEKIVPVSDTNIGDDTYKHEIDTNVDKIIEGQNEKERQKRRDELDWDKAPEPPKEKQH